MKIRAEVIYRTTHEVEVDADHYLDPDKAFELESTADAEDVWSDMLESDGATAEYYKVQLVDGDTVVLEKVVFGDLDQVKPTL